ncbi:PREDICTED: lens epithelial cell protein LEP503 [Miniopterus natalensis]|uniref:lens epithelial cell protein LEP503 n=1 Tax=Miniopterus natalensis TaxID=291302 RepID=UPI0007A71B65|nr:PREDICTED: lens epithelial cell protein LEP503 [Miniopterus natalensis]
MRPEGVGTVLIKGTRGSSLTLRAAVHMQVGTQALAQALPFSLRGALGDAGLRVPIAEMGTRWQGLQSILKEIAYVLLCCWCIKELLD